MKIKYKPTREEVRKQRKERYLSEHPIETQIEALTEAAMGRPEKLDTLILGLSRIRQETPYS